MLNLEVIGGQLRVTVMSWLVSGKYPQFVFFMVFFTLVKFLAVFLLFHNLPALTANLALQDKGETDSLLISQCLLQDDILLLTPAIVTALYKNG